MISLISAVRAGTNTLATQDNLAKWGRPVDTRCSIDGCDNYWYCTLGHMLRACSKSLDGGTVLPDLMLAEQIPDLVTIDKTVTPAKEVLLALRVLRDSATSFKAALDRKTAQYERLALDLEEKRFVPLEIKCRTDRIPCNLFNITAHQRLKGALGRIVLLGS